LKYVEFERKREKKYFMRVVNSQTVLSPKKKNDEKGKKNNQSKNWHWHESGHETEEKNRE
jgi:hypothetical protein